ncbi:hypothetical protein QJS66_03375 [Kocuria rhizophila]|nr:hypothetical protein QJS66_03375 [Kocuria rhizophila]
MALKERLTFVKLGQLTSTRPDLLPPGYAELAAQLQDNTPPIPVEQIRAMIEASWTPRRRRSYHMDRAPVATDRSARPATRPRPGPPGDREVRRPGSRTRSWTWKILQDMASWPPATYRGQDYDLEGIVEEFSMSAPTSWTSCR